MSSSTNPNRRYDTITVGSWQCCMCKRNNKTGGFNDRCQDPTGSCAQLVWVASNCTVSGQNHKRCANCFPPDFAKIANMPEKRRG